MVSELSPTGSALLYSTFLGGSGDDWGYSIAVDPANKVYVLGTTEGPQLPGHRRGLPHHPGRPG